MIPSAPVKKILSNPVKTRDDATKLVGDLLTPLADALSDGCGRVRLSTAGAVFDNAAAELEGFARALWGLAPALAAEPNHPVLRPLGDLWAKGLDNGTNPDHEDFWGWPVGRDQRLVEMCGLGVAIGMTPEVFWHPQSAEAKERINKWLLTINDVEVVENNWMFFRVLVNVGLKRVGAKYSEAHIKDTLDFIDTFYTEAEDMPADGANATTQAYDYYATLFAIPFYGLLYAKLNPDPIDPERVAKIYHRAEANMPRAVHFFSQDGSMIAYGRSMIYRFAGSCFWSAVAYTWQGEPPAPFSWGVLKGLVLRSIRCFTQTEGPFNRDGSLTIGWAYPNTNMVEEYNSPQSPYWALKAFLMLAMPADHPFWTAEEAPIPAQFDTGAVVKPWKQTFSHAAGHTFLLTQGQHTNWPMHQTAAKYGKFAYSSTFGFSVIGGVYGLGGYAPDSTIALCDDDDGETWKVPRLVGDVSVSDEGVIKSTWKPWKDVTVTTWLVPPPNADSPYHTRVHHITTARDLKLAAAGFANNNPYQVSVHGLGNAEGRELSERGALATSEAGVTAVFDLLGGTKPHIQQANPNTNIIFPRSVIPLLKGEVKAGDEKWVALRVVAAPCAQKDADKWVQQWRALEGWNGLEGMRAEYPFIQ